MTDLVADQRLGGAIAWGATEIPMIIVMIALLSQWARSDEREARRSDRIGDRADDEELDAYNRMLAGLAEQDASRSAAAAAMPRVRRGRARSTGRAGVSVLIRPEEPADRAAVQALIGRRSRPPTGPPDRSSRSA